MSSVEAAGNSSDAKYLRDHAAELTSSILTKIGPERIREAMALVRRMSAAGIPSSNTSFRTLTSVIYSTYALEVAASTP